MRYENQCQMLEIFFDVFRVESSVTIEIYRDLASLDLKSQSQRGDKYILTNVVGLTWLE